MPMAWIENGAIRDISPAPDPYEIYTPNVAALYNTDVPDYAEKGMVDIDGTWQFPPPPPPPDPPPLDPPVTP